MNVFNVCFTPPVRSWSSLLAAAVSPSYHLFFLLDNLDNLEENSSSADNRNSSRLEGQRTTARPLLLRCPVLVILLLLISLPSSSQFSSSSSLHHSKTLAKFSFCHTNLQRLTQRCSQQPPSNTRKKSSIVVWAAALLILERATHNDQRVE